MRLRLFKKTLPVLILILGVSHADSVWATPKDEKAACMAALDGRATAEFVQTLAGDGRRKASALMLVSIAAREDSELDAESQLLATLGVARTKAEYAGISVSIDPLLIHREQGVALVELTGTVAAFRRLMAQEFPIPFLWIGMNRKSETPVEEARVRGPRPIVRPDPQKVDVDQGPDIRKFDPSFALLWQSWAFQSEEKPLEGKVVVENLSSEFVVQDMLTDAGLEITGKIVSEMRPRGLLHLAPVRGSQTAFARVSHLRHVQTVYASHQGNIERVIVGEGLPLTQDLSPALLLQLLERREEQGTIQVDVVVSNSRLVEAIHRDLVELGLEVETVDARRRTRLRVNVPIQQFSRVTYLSGIDAITLPGEEYQ